MEDLILEIKTPGLHRYYAINKEFTRIGRAFDNDIILSEPTVAAHHLQIHRHGDEIRLENFASVNPTQFDSNSRVDMSDSALPTEFKLGRISARLLRRDESVSETRPLAGNGRSFHLFDNAIWAFLLPVICLIVGGLNYYLDSHSLLKWGSLFASLLRDTALSLTGYIVALAIIERLLVNRWEARLVTICVCLAYLLSVAATILVELLMYMFSSLLPSTLFTLGWILIFIPAAISLYLIHISHLRTGRSILLALFITSPFAFPAIMDSPVLRYLTQDFSATANYHKTLNPLNWHLSETVSVTIFIEQAQALEAGEFVD